MFGLLVLEAAKNEEKIAVFQIYHLAFTKGLRYYTCVINSGFQVCTFIKKKVKKKEGKGVEKRAGVPMCQFFSLIFCLWSYFVKQAFLVEVKKNPH